MTELPSTSKIGKTWHNLPPEIHTKIISLMPFNDRLRMKLVCSYALKICNNLPNELNECNILVLNRTISITTTDGTKLKCNVEDGTKFSSVQNYESDGKFIAFLLVLKKCRIKRFKILMFGLTEDMRADFERIMADSDMQVDTFDFHTGDVNLIGKFLEFSRKPSPAIEVHGTHSCKMIFDSILDIPVVQEARSIRIIKMNCAVSDAQLLRLTAKKIQLSGTLVTANGINHLLRTFLEGKRDLRLVSIEIVDGPVIELEQIVQELEQCGATISISEPIAIIRVSTYQIFVEIYEKKPNTSLIHISVDLATLRQKDENPK